MALASNLSNPSKMTNSIILLVVGLTVTAALLPSLFTAFTNISNVSGLGVFGSFFGSGGFIGLLIGAALVIGILGAIGIGRAKR